jgi:hypothetical protein
LHRIPLSLKLEHAHLLLDVCLAYPLHAGAIPEIYLNVEQVGNLLESQQCARPHRFGRSKRTARLVPKHCVGRLLAAEISSCIIAAAT